MHLLNKEIEELQKTILVEKEKAKLLPNQDKNNENILEKINSEEDTSNKINGKKTEKEEDEYYDHHLRRNNDEENEVQDEVIDLMGKISRQFNKDNKENNDNKDSKGDSIEDKNIKVKKLSEKDNAQMIYLELFDILKEMKYKSTEYLNINFVQDDSNDVPALFYKSCGFIFVDSDSNKVSFKFQTFRIVSQLRIYNLKIQVMSFWGLEIDISKYKYFFMNGKESLIEVTANYDEMTIESYLKLNSNVRQAIFVFHSVKIRK